MTKTRFLALKLSGFKTIGICILLLNILSLSAIYSGLHQGGKFVGQEILSRQMIWMALGWSLLILFAFIDYRHYQQTSFLLYIFNIILLIAVLAFGKKAMGAQRWLTVFGFTFQPSELSKITTVLILAHCFSGGGRTTLVKNFLLPFLLVIINAFIIFRQPDLGTALIIVFLFFAVGLFSKVKKRYFIILIAIGILGAPIALGTLKDYQKQRLMVFRNPDSDPLGAGYTIIQSKIAIGSGELTGKGFLAGTQSQFNFLPERHTDFIFTVIAEEWGFLGASALLLLYWFILRKILQKAAAARDDYTYLLCIGISILFFLHIFVNTAMTLGILPVVGLPLIFLSYGGTNLLINFILMGVFLNICHSKRY
jgi:rod shape determining protein RodA